MKELKAEDIIKTARESKELTQQQVADSLGIGLRSYQFIEAGRFPKNKVALIVNLESVLGIKVYDIIYGDTTNVSRERASYVSRRLEKKNNASQFMVPLVPVKAQAGYSKSYADTDFINKLETFPILPGIDHRGAEWRWFEVEGDSMIDTFEEGQYLLTSQVIQEDWKNIDNYYVYVVVTAEKVMIKRLAKIRGKDYWAAISDNEESYPQFRLPVSEVKELWKYRRHVDWNASPKRKFEIKV